MEFSRRNNGGFSLLELSIVLAIVGLVTGMGIYAGMGAMESARKAQTENKLNAIEKSLMAYRLAHNRLPCPASPTLPETNANYGLDWMAVTSACADATAGSPTELWPDGTEVMTTGAVPVITLGLPNEFMYDGWGRQFQYAVTSESGQLDAFRRLDVDAQCAIDVMDATGADRTNGNGGGALYVLISHGPNGHGAFLRGGTRFSSGSTNADELQNCHCNSTGGITYDPFTPIINGFVAKEPTRNPAVLTDEFDDIVRFKARWQMQSYDDYKNPPILPYIAIGQRAYTAAPATAPIYKASCNGVWVPTMTGWPADYGVSSINGMEFMPDNDYLFVYSGLAGNNCRMLRIVGSALTNLGNPMLPAASCPAYNAANRVSMSNNGYLAITYPAGVSLFKHASGSLTSLGSTALSPAVAAMPVVTVFGKNADYLFLSDRATYDRLYVRTGERQFESVTTMPPAAWTAPDLASLAGQIRSAAFSPDGKYFAIGTNADPKVRLWRIDANNIFTSIASLSPVMAGIADSIAFSHDSRFLAVGGAVTPGANNMYIYRIDANDAFTVEFNNISNPGVIYSLTGAPGSSFVVYGSYNPGATEFLEVRHRLTVGSWAMYALPVAGGFPLDFYTVGVIH